MPAKTAQENTQRSEANACSPLRNACQLYEDGQWDALQDEFDDMEDFCDALVSRYLEEHPDDSVISVTQEDMEWALSKFVKPNTMRAMIDRLKKRAR